MGFRRIHKTIIFQLIILTIVVIAVCFTGDGKNYELNTEELKQERSQSMPNQYVFFYMMKKDMKKDVNEIKHTVQEHIKYWHDNKPENYSGGPFSDRSGGMILFSADSLTTAEKLAMNDPFVKNDLIQIKWIKEWQMQ